MKAGFILRPYPCDLSSAFQALFTSLSRQRFLLVSSWLYSPRLPILLCWSVPSPPPWQLERPGREAGQSPPPPTGVLWIPSPCHCLRNASNIMTPSWPPLHLCPPHTSVWASTNSSNESSARREFSPSQTRSVLHGCFRFMAAHSPRGSAHLHPSFFAHLMLIHEHTLLTMNFKIQAGSNYVSPPPRLPPRSHYYHLSPDHINFSVSVHPAPQPTPIMGAGAFVTESPDWVTSLTKAFKSSQ